MAPAPPGKKEKVSRVRTHASLRRARPGGGATVLDYIESPEWRGWYAHDFDSGGHYLRLRRCTPDQVRELLAEKRPSQFSEPRRSQQ
jgi:hypothetical protein